MKLAKFAKNTFNFALHYLDDQRHGTKGDN